MKWLCTTLAMMTVAGSSAAAFDLQGHRGARGLAPENTIPAFAKALAIGVTTLEPDVAVTKDGVLVVHHDERLDPNTTRGPDGRFLSERGPALPALPMFWYFWCFLTVGKTTQVLLAHPLESARMKL